MTVTILIWSTSFIPFVSSSIVAFSQFVTPPPPLGFCGSLLNPNLGFFLKVLITELWIFVCLFVFLMLVCKDRRGSEPSAVWTSLVWSAWEPEVSLLSFLEKCGWSLHSCGTARYMRSKMHSDKAPSFEKWLAKIYGLRVLCLSEVLGEFSVLVIFNPSMGISARILTSTALVYRIQDVPNRKPSSWQQAHPLWAWYFWIHIGMWFRKSWGDQLLAWSTFSRECVLGFLGIHRSQQRGGLKENIAAIACARKGLGLDLWIPSSAISAVLSLTHPQ